MTPSARIEVNGQEVSTRFTDERGVLVSISITDEAGLKADSCDITIDDRDRFVSAAKGDEIRVWLGYEPAPVYMGRYIVERVQKSGPRRVMRVSAKAAELAGTIRAAKTRSHHETTLGEIARKVAAEHDLEPIIAPALKSVAIPHVDQQTESDLAFPSRLAIRSGAMFKVADGKLVLAQKGSATLASGERNASTTLHPDEVESWDWESGSRADYKAVVCSYRDDAKGARPTVTAGDASSQNKHRDRKLYGSKGEAEAAAKAQLGDFARGRVSASLEGPGMPEVFAESEVILDGFDREMDATYRVKSVRHSFDAGGFRSSVALEIGGGVEDET